MHDEGMLHGTECMLDMPVTEKTIYILHLKLGGSNPSGDVLR